MRPTARLPVRALPVRALPVRALPVRALHVLALVVPVVLVAAGCARSTAVTRPPVSLTLTSPADGESTLAGAVTVSGRVSPAWARVLVLGRAVGVRDGAFSVPVALGPGMTVIDVIAGAAHAQAAVAAVRVTRDVLITVPNVVGESPSQAEARLRAADLGVHTFTDRNPLRFLVPFPEQVCQMSPAPGTRVAPKSTVTLQLDKICS